MPNKKFRMWRDNAYEMLLATGEGMTSSTLVKRVIGKNGKPFKFHPHSNGVAKLLQGDGRFDIVDEKGKGVTVGSAYTRKVFRAKKLGDEKND